MIWKLFLLSAIVFAWIGLSHTHTVSAAPRPRVLVLATGGTIAGSAASPEDVTGYRSGAIGIGEILSAVPELGAFADVHGEQLCNIDSKDMTDEILIRLAVRVNEILAGNEADGIVITHGTDTMEETAFFLSLTVKTNKPVVLTGAMLPATARNADGPRNLLDAVRVAARPESADKGILVVMNGKIFAAKEVTKTHTTKIDAFASPDFSPLGYVDENGVAFERTPNLPRLHFPAESSLPRVDILYGHEGDDGALAEAALRAGAKGIVYAGMGNGNIPAKAEKILAKASEKGIVVIRASRSNSGPVLPADPSYTAAGFIDGSVLNPQKARILLRLALGQTEDQEEVRRIFREYLNP